jgi:hypothetical protein
MTAIEFFLQKAQCFLQELEKLYWFLGIRNTAFWQELLRMVETIPVISNFVTSWFQALSFLKQG